MKVALITDADWLMREMATLRRLAVGLVGETVRVVRVVPRWWGDLGDNLTMTGELLLYDETNWRWLRDYRLRQCAEPLRKMGVDVVHVLDGSLQRVGLNLSEAMGVPAVCSVWSRHEAGELRAAPGNGSFSTAYTAATGPLAEPCREQLGETANLRVVPPGVYGSAGEEIPPPLSRPDRMISCVVVGDGRADEHYRSLLEGMARVKPKLSQVMYFLYSVATDQHQLWCMAEELGLLDQVSLVPFEPGSHDLMVQADVLIQPQPLGCVRTLVLEAMAAGRPVVSAADPMLDHLIHGRTARIMDHPSAEDWARFLTELVEEPQGLIELGEAGRRYVCEHHSAAAFLESMLDVYRKVVTPAPIPFEPNPRANG